MGALVVLSHDENPDRICLAAHGIRELIEKLPAHLKPPIVFRKDNMNSKIRPMALAWESASTSVVGAEVSLKVNRPLRKFFEEARTFFDWLRTSAPDRIRERQALMQRLDPGGSSLLRERVAAWTEFNEFFQKVGHHHFTGSTEEFVVELERFEAFLLSVLVPPPTFERIDEIDALLKESGG
jgi:hypothetical protein